MSTWANVIKAGVARFIDHFLYSNPIQDYSSQGNFESSQPVARSQDLEN